MKTMMKRLAGAAALATMISAGAATAATVTQTFGPAFNHDDGSGRVEFSIGGLSASIVGDLTIDFSVAGDLNANTEVFKMYVDGQNFGRGCDGKMSNGSFGIAGDVCGDTPKGLQQGQMATAQLVIENSVAADLLSDGTLDLRFWFNRAVNDFTDITAPINVSGVTFEPARNFAFGVGGTISYDTATRSLQRLASVAPPPVPLPASGLLLIAGLGGVAALRKRRKAS